MDLFIGTGRVWLHDYTCTHSFMDRTARGTSQRSRLILLLCALSSLVLTARHIRRATRIGDDRRAMVFAVPVATDGRRTLPRQKLLVTPAAPSATVAAPSATVAAPSATFGAPSATVAAPSATIRAPLAIVAAPSAISAARGGGGGASARSGAVSSTNGGWETQERWGSCRGVIKQIKYSAAWFVNAEMLRKWPASGLDEERLENPGTMMEGASFLLFEGPGRRMVYKSADLLRFYVEHLSWYERRLLSATASRDRGERLQNEPARAPAYCMASRSASAVINGGRDASRRLLCANTTQQQVLASARASFRELLEQHTARRALAASAAPPDDTIAIMPFFVLPPHRAPCRVENERERESKFWKERGRG